MNPPMVAIIKTIPSFAELLNRDDLLSDDRNVTNAFFKETVHQNNGVTDYLFRYRRPSSNEGTDSEAYLVLQLDKGVTGQAHIAHGGFLATVMDEVTGGLIGATGIDNGHGMFTLSMKLEYLKPVYAPGTIMAVAGIAKREGRKVFLEAYIKDTCGDVCTKAEVLFIIKRPHKS